MPKLIDEHIPDEIIDQYVSLAKRIAERCTSDDRTVDSRPNPLLVGILMVGDNLAQGNDGNWNQLEQVWSMLMQIRDNQPFNK